MARSSQEVFGVADVPFRTDLRISPRARAPVRFYWARVGLTAVKTLLTGYRVADLGRALAFYRNVGFREVGRVATGDGVTRVMLNLPGDGDVVTLELVHEPAVGRIDIGNGFSHLAIQVDDLAATLTDLDAKGVAHRGIERPAGENGPAVCILRDPDGYRIELVEWPPGHPADMTSADFH
jgi:lactoylglutathione lyase